MTPLKTGLYVRIEEFVNRSKPFPSSSIFSTGQACRTLGLYNPSKTSDAYVVLSHDHDEIRFIYKRDVRARALLPDQRAFVLPGCGTAHKRMVLM